MRRTYFQLEGAEARARALSQSEFADYFQQMLDFRVNIEVQSFLVGEAVEYLEHKAKGYVTYLNKKLEQEHKKKGTNVDKQRLLSLAGLVSGVNHQSGMSQ